MVRLTVKEYSVKNSYELNVVKVAGSELSGVEETVSYFSAGELLGVKNVDPVLVTCGVCAASESVHIQTDYEAFRAGTIC